MGIIYALAIGAATIVGMVLFVLLFSDYDNNNSKRRNL